MGLIGKKSNRNLLRLLATSALKTSGEKKMTYGVFETKAERFWEVANEASNTNYRAFYGLCEAEEALDEMSKLLSEIECNVDIRDDEERDDYNQFLQNAKIALSMQQEKYDELESADSFLVAYWLDINHEASRGDAESRLAFELPEGEDDDEAIAREYIEGRGGIDRLEPEYLDAFFDYKAFGKQLREETNLGSCDGWNYYFWNTF